MQLPGRLSQHALKPRLQSEVRRYFDVKVFAASVEVTSRH
jgi:hypothetical protein